MLISSRSARPTTPPVTSSPNSGIRLQESLPSADQLHKRERGGAIVIVSFLLLATDHNSISLEMQTAAQLRRFSHAAHVGAGLDPALRKDLELNELVAVRITSMPRTACSGSSTPRTVMPSICAASSQNFCRRSGSRLETTNFFDAANGKQSLENAKGVSPDAEQAQALRIFPRHMFGGDGHDRGGSQGPEWKAHEREQLAGLRIKKQRVHLVAAAETAIRAQSYSDSSRFQSSARNYAQATMAADRNMVRRMGHDIAMRLLPVGLFDQLDRFLQIEQRSKLITTQK